MTDTTVAVPAIGGGTRGFGWSIGTALIAAGISFGALVVYLLPAVIGRPLAAVPETRVAEVAREMLQRNDCVLPHLGREPYVELPPMPYWQAALSSALFFGGASSDSLQMTRAALLPPALNAAMTIFLVVFFGSVFFGRSSGICVGLILAASDLFAYYAQSGYGDVSLMASCAATVCGVAMLLSERPGLGAALLAGFGLGIGILTKGHIPIVLIVLPCGVEMFLRRKSLTGFNAVYLAMAFMFALLIATPWFVLVSRSSPAAIDALISEAKSALFATSPNLDPNHCIGYYFERGAIGLLPWTPLLLIGILLAVRPLKSEDPTPSDERAASRFFVLYAVMGFIVFLIAHKKYEHYLLPLLPAMALASGAMFGRLKVPGGISEERIGWSQLAIGIVGTLAIGSAPFWPAILNTLYPLGLNKDGYLAGRALAFSSTFGTSAIPVAIVFFVACFISARLWTLGKGVIAIAIFAALMMASEVYSSVNPAEISRHTSFWTAAANLKLTAENLPANARLYGHADGFNDTALLFYTGRPVRPLSKYPADPAQPGAPVFVIAFGKLATLLDIPLSESSTKAGEFSLIEVTPALEALLRDAIAKKLPVEK